MSVHHSSTDVLPQLLIFTQPTGDSSCRSFHSPHCHLAQTALQAGGDFHCAQEHISYLRKKKSTDRKHSLEPHISLITEKQEASEKTQIIYRHVSRIQSHESFTEETQLSHCESLTCLLEDLWIFCISIYKCSYKILAEMLQICVHVCVSVLRCHYGGKIWLSYDNG